MAEDKMDEEIILTPATTFRYLKANMDCHFEKWRLDTLEKVQAEIRKLEKELGKKYEM